MSFNKLASNALWNLAGQLAPLIIAIGTLPLLIKALAIERYGFLSLALVLIGYAGLFDFGISRAMTRLVAQHLAANDPAGARRVGGVATTYMVLLGIVAGLFVGFFSHIIVTQWLHIPAALQSEAINAMWLLAASMPVVLVTASYRGYIEACQHFKPLSLVRIFMGVFSSVGPLLAALVSPRLEVVVGSLVALRVIVAIAHMWVAGRYCNFQYVPTAPDKATSRTLFSLGGWITVSNVVGPIMTTMDRFILGGMVTVELVAYYATPYDLISRVMIIPFALMAALFPMIAGLGGDTARIRETYHAIIRLLFVAMFPVTFIAITLGGAFLKLWLGHTFASQGTIVLQILAVGVLANSLAQAPANLIQALGRPKWMALSHLVELPLFLAGIWYFTGLFGIAGTALTWTIRAVVDCVVMFAMANSWLTHSTTRLRPVLLSIGISLGLMACGFATSSPVQSLLLCTTGTMVFGLFAWRVVLTEQDKARVLKLVPRAGFSRR